MPRRSRGSPQRRAALWKRALSQGSLVSLQKEEVRKRDEAKYSRKKLTAKEILEQKEEELKQELELGRGQNGGDTTIGSDADPANDIIYEGRETNVEDHPAPVVYEAFAKEASNMKSFLPRVKASNGTKSILAPYALDNTRNFPTRLQGRAYADLKQGRLKDLERRLKVAGIKTRKKKEKVFIPKIGYDIHDASGGFSFIFGAAQLDRLNNNAFKFERQQSLDEKRMEKMRHTLWRMHAQMVKAGFGQWILFFKWHRKEYGKDSLLGKIEEVNRIIKAKNIRHKPKQHIRGILPKDMVLFRCLECDVDGDLRPCHVVECSPDDTKRNALKVVGRVESVADSQMRRSGKSSSMYSLVYRIRDPKFPMTEEEKEVNARFVRQCICFQPFLIETTPILSNLAPEFPNFISRPHEEKEYDNDDYSDDESDVADWVPTQNLWIERTTLVPEELLEEVAPYRLKRFTRAVKHLEMGRKRLGWELFKHKYKKEAHSYFRVQKSIVLQCFWRSVIARHRAKTFYRSRVRLDRKEQRARLRITKKAREEVRRRKAQRLRRNVGLSVDSKWFHLTKSELNDWWRDREKGGNILQKYINKLRLSLQYEGFCIWRIYTRNIIMKLHNETRPKSSLEMLEEYEREHADEFAEVYDPNAAPWHAAVGIRMPLLMTRDSIGAHTDMDGKVRITNLERWRRFKERMAGPTDNSHWLLQGALREDGTSLNARLLLGGYPRGKARPLVKDEKKHSSALAQLLLAGVDTFVCLSEWEKSDEEAIKEVHRELRSELRVAVESARVRYKRAMLGAEKAKDYAIAQRSAMVARKVEAGNVLKLNQIAYNRLTKYLRFAVHIITQNPGIPVTMEEEQNFQDLLVHLERRLRRRERLYIFSEHGHGRAGMVGACLLGRLYGITCADALELVQRSHDCRVDQTLPAAMVLGMPTAMARGWRADKVAVEYSRGPRKAYVSCPRLARQRQLVRRILNPIQTNFNPTQLRDETGPLVNFMQTRKEIFMSTQTHKNNLEKEKRERLNKEAGK
jgi:hypothetical protein